ncbi:related to Mitochondrial carrier protein MTM1 [Saccharomycodes ludwigii]|uniref:Related to Mitochondrial carrier protein MTM1 n=2 Tax=Saccharomycodes ludwigii TaxID=36035 RepID=A0A376B1D4_9ASCO|nr:related to Mitochondrial carrier protein MTM1 [Saccharomycodes ludwigii]
MDVVRIRIQQQQILPKCGCTTLPHQVPNSNNTLLQPYINKGKLFWQEQCFRNITCDNSLRFDNTVDAFRKISRIEGLNALWRGLSITLLMAIPSNVVYFSGYETLRDYSPLNANFPTINPLVCGALARTIAATTIAPLELLKTRLQSIPSIKSNSLKIFKDLMQETKIEINSLGYKALFKGLEITLFRDVPFSAIYWGSYEFYKKNFWVSPTSSSNGQTNANWIHFLNSFLGGSLSGALAALITHPFDVGKTRLQISIIQNNDNKNQQQKTQNLDKNMFKYLNNIRKLEGITALYAGLVPRVVKVAPSCAIMISTYEISKKFFQNS